MKLNAGVVGWSLAGGLALYVGREHIGPLWTTVGPYLAVGLVGLVVLAVLGWAGVFLRAKIRSRRYVVGKSMQAARLTQFISKTASTAEELAPCFEVAQLPTPVPRAGEVLIRIEASPVNPSDRSTLQGTYNRAQRSNLPCTLGYEASGVVVASGGGFLANLRVGQRVGCISKVAGTWAEYAVVSATQCFPVPDHVTFVEASSMFVNPLTAIAFMEIAQQARCSTIVITAAASALGRMIIRLGRTNGIRVIALIRSAKDRELLVQLGALEVIVTSEPEWQPHLKELCASHQARICFDAVAGELTGQVLACLPPSSTIYVYGGLSNQPCGAIRPTQLLFDGSRVLGFWLTRYIRSKTPIGMYLWMNQVTRLLKTALRSEYGQSYPLEHLAQAVINSNPDHGKSVIAPHSH